MDLLSWMLPPSFSTFGADIDRVYYWILWITGIVFFATEGLLIYYLIRYRHKEGRKATYTHGSTKAEIIWTAIPTLILVVIGVTSIGIWHRVKVAVPDGAMQVIVTGKQFEWNVTYPGADDVLGTDDDFTKLAEMHIPVNRPIHVRLRSEDVIHSFTIPDFRVKQDAVPGTEIPVWFEATAAGEYIVGCAELCGLGHYRMAGRVIALEEGEFQAWQAAEIQAGQQ